MLSTFVTLDLGQENVMSTLTPRERELVALGAAMGSNCVPCVEHHIPESQRAGLTGLEVREAIEYADRIRQVPARKVLDAALKLLASSPTDDSGNASACGCSDQSAKAASTVVAEKPAPCAAASGDGKCC